MPSLKDRIGQEILTKEESYSIGNIQNRITSIKILDPSLTELFNKKIQGKIDTIVDNHLYPPIDQMEQFMEDLDELTELARTLVGRSEQISVLALHLIDDIVEFKKGVRRALDAYFAKLSQKTE